MGADVLDDAARSLLAAVILQAVKDAKAGHRDALAWLRSTRCAGFLAWLDLPPEVQTDLVAHVRAARAKTRRTLKTE